MKQPKTNVSTMEKKRIIIFYQHINREYQSCLVLKEELERSIHCEVYIFSIDFEFSKALKIADKKINLVFMPWVYHELNYELLMPFFKHNEALISVNLHHEQIGSDVSSNILIPRGENARNSVLHLAWGGDFKETLIKNGVKDEFVFEVGHMRLDTVDKNIRSRDDLAAEFALDTSKKWLLFCESRGWIWSYSQKYKNDFVANGYSVEEIDEFYNIAKKSIYATFEDFDKIGDAFFSEYEIIYRPHPGTVSPVKINERIRHINAYSIYDWLKNVDVYATWSSTSIFESESCGVPSFVVKPFEYDKKYEMHGVQKYSEVQGLEQITSELIREEKQCMKKQRIFENYIGKQGGAIANIVGLTASLLADGVKGYKMAAIKYPRSRKNKKQFFEFVTWLFVKFGLLKIFKYPRSSYKQISDIPYIKKNMKKYEKC